MNTSRQSSARSQAGEVRLTWPGKHLPPREPAALRLVQAYDSGPGQGGWRNVLAHGDNAVFMSALLAERAGTIDLIYADPPFATGGAFHIEGAGAARLAYRDSWGSGVEAYLQMLYERLALMRELLSRKGSLWLHIDWRVGHYARALLDELFGRECFRNSVVWHYGGRGAKAVAGQFPRNHDVLLFYSKTAEARFRRAFTSVRLSANEARGMGYRQDAAGRWFKTAPRGDYTDASVERLERAGRVHRTRSGKVRVKYFLREENGYVVDRKLLGDVWDDIPDMMHARAWERTGYPTQKPEALLTRILEACSKPGDAVADFFCGSGTTLVAAEKLGRRWIGCDASEAAIEVTRQRLLALPRRAAFDMVQV